MATKLTKSSKNAKLNYALGDVNTTEIKTHNGCTVVLYYDTQSPRPYDLGFCVQGTRGIYEMAKDSIYIEGLSPREQWESIESHREKYEHPLWRTLGASAQNDGPGGSDYVTLHQFVKAVRERNQPEQDVYDAAQPGASFRPFPRSLSPRAAHLWSFRISLAANGRHESHWGLAFELREVWISFELPMSP